jgi:hypothetical protein
MSSQIDTTSSIGDVITGTAGWMFAFGVLTMTLFPWAIPGIVLTAAAVLPLVLLAIVAAVLAAVAAVPVLAVRGLRRRVGRGARRPPD